MVTMTIQSVKAAERQNSPYPERNHAKKRSYVALLVRGERGTVDRKWVEKNRCGNKILFSVTPQPGDIYEICRWQWDHIRQQFMGGTIWIGFESASKPIPLSRSEAFASILNERLSGEAGQAPSVQRVIPEWVTLS